MLLTRAPLESTNINTGVISFDLHVLNTPPAFVLSQNQTLRKNSEKNDPASLLKRLLFIFQIDFGELIRGCPHPYSPRPRASSDNLMVIVNQRAAHNSIIRLFPTRGAISLAAAEPSFRSILAAGTSCVRPLLSKNLVLRVD